MTMRDAEKKMERLLDTERALLLKGDVPGLERIATQKEKLLAQPISLGDGTLRQKAERNQALLDATMRGIAAVRDRIATLRKGAPGGTYSAFGERQSIARPAKRLEKRA